MNTRHKLVAALFLLVVVVLAPCQAETDNGIDPDDIERVDCYRRDDGGLDCEIRLKEK